MSELVIRGLEKSFGPARVLRGLDLTVRQGDLCAVLGPSGCGKTTLLRIVAGFDAPDRGTVALDGRVVSLPGASVPPERRRVGVVPQEGALFPHLTVAANVGFGLRGAPVPALGEGGAGSAGWAGSAGSAGSAGRAGSVGGVGSAGWRGWRRGRGARAGAAARSQRVAELLELVGLQGLGERMPAELSGGQQQRVALARALAPDPALVLLDEPFTALDTGLRAALREDVRAALRGTGATAVLVTHDQQEALSIADSVAVLRDGVVVQAAAPDDLYTAPGDVGVATFVGEAVVLPAVLAAGSAWTSLGELPVRPCAATTAPASTTAATAVTPAAAAAPVGEVVIRPEQILLGPPRAGVPARVLGTAYYGHDALVTLELLDAAGSGPAGGRHGAGSRGVTQVSARSSGAAVLADGTIVGLRVDGAVSFFPGPASGAAATGEASGSATGPTAARPATAPVAAEGAGQPASATGPALSVTP